MTRTLALALCLSALLAARVSADIQVSSDQGPPGQFDAGDPGTLTFSANENATLRVSRPGQAKRIAFDKKAFTAAGGGTVKVKIKLKRADLALVKRSRKLTTSTTADVRDAAGNRARPTARQSLLAPRR
jgi:hypothetical protein